MLAYLRDPKIALSLRVDPQRVVVAGHSMSGGITVQVAAKDRALIGAVLISPRDMSSDASELHDRLVADMADNMETLALMGAGARAHDQGSDQSGDGDPDGLAEWYFGQMSPNNSFKPQPLRGSA